MPAYPKEHMVPPIAKAKVNVPNVTLAEATTSTTVTQKDGDGKLKFDGAVWQLLAKFS